MSKLPPPSVSINRVTSWPKWEQENEQIEQQQAQEKNRLAQAKQAHERLGHQQHVALRFKMPQYSRWVSSDLRRLFIVLDHWHGEKAQVKLLEVDTCQEIIRDSAEVLQAIKDGKLVAF